MKPLIVIVEDNVVILGLIEFNLKNEGYEVRAFHDGESMLDEKEAFENLTLFILDIMLQDINRFEICSKIRRIPQLDMVPMIILTDGGSETDKVKALDSGADDYITKPFSVREFIARVNANARKYIKLTGRSFQAEATDGNNPESKKSHTWLFCDGIQLDDIKHRVYKDNHEIEITNREYELLKFLMLHRGITYTRNDLFIHVWRYKSSEESRTVDVHISNLRHKLEKDVSNPKIIETIHGRGYRFRNQ